MLDDVTPEELIAVAQALQSIPENLAVLDRNNQLVFLAEHPDLVTFAEKMNEAALRPDVQAFMAEHYPQDPDEPLEG